MLNLCFLWFNVVYCIFLFSLEEKVIGRVENKVGIGKLVKF